MNKSIFASKKTPVPVPVPKKKSVTFEETKSNYIEPDYINADTDSDIINKFCALTNATNDIAVQFLKEMQWNIIFAVNKYYSVDHNVAHNVVETDDHAQNNLLVYSHGVSFWYWNKQKTNKRYIQANFINLKQEILQFKQFSLKLWNFLVEECKILKNTDKIKSMSSNGVNIDIYGIKSGEVIKTNHLCAIKLYTDYTWLCGI
eukprot:437931_1